MILFLLLLLTTLKTMAMDLSERHILLERQAILLALLDRPATDPEAFADRLLLLQETQRDIRLLETPEHERIIQPLRPLRHRIKLNLSEHRRLLADKKKQPSATTRNTCCCLPFFFK